jgi:hypothetical protein
MLRTRKESIPHKKRVRLFAQLAAVPYARSNQVHHAYHLLQEEGSSMWIPLIELPAIWLFPVSVYCYLMKINQIIPPAQLALFHIHSHYARSN